MDRSGDSSTNELVENNLDLVGKAVAQVSARFPRHVDRQELWNAGALGLVEAAKRFDPEAGIPFERYAITRVRGAIIDSTRSRDWASRSVRRKARELEQAAEDLRDGTGKTIKSDDLAAAMGISSDEVDKIRARSASSMLLYLDHEQSEDGPTLRESITSPDIEGSPEASLEAKEMLGTLSVAVENLSGIHREVIERYYLQGELLQDVADDLGVTQARVSQIRSEALMSLRAYFGTLYDGTTAADDSAPGKRARAAYLAQVSAQSTWRTRLDAADAAAEMARSIGA